MHPKLLLIVTACVETVTGLCLLSLPAVVFDVILALDHPRVDTILVGRLAGAALFAIGVASWIARSDTLTHAHLGLLIGVLVYNALASILLVFAGVICRCPALARGRASWGARDLVFELSAFEP